MNTPSNIIFISNSLPKSGSTLLFNLQRSFIEGVFGAKTDYSQLEDYGININGGFIANADEPRLVEAVRNIKKFNTPLVLKMHTCLSSELEQEFLSNSNLHISLCVRDPAEIFMSAQRNYIRTGEFSEFSSTDSGLAMVNGWFKKIFINTVRISAKKKIQIIGYETLKADPISAMIYSLSPTITEIALRKTAERYTDMDEVLRLSAHRLSDKTEQREIGAECEEWLNIFDSTTDFRNQIRTAVEGV